MREFRFHKSFEDELAKKADQFSMQPSSRLWDGVESGLNKGAAVKARIKLAGIGSGITLIALLAILIWRNNDHSTSKALGDKGVLPPTSLNIPAELQQQSAPAPVIPGIEQSEKNTSIPSAVKTIKAEGSIASIPSKEQASSQNRMESSSIAYNRFHIDKPELNPGKGNKQNYRIKSQNYTDGWNLMVQAGANYNYRNLNTANPYADEVKSTRDRTDRYLAGLAINARVRYFWSERVSFSTGINYRQTGERIAIQEADTSPYYNALFNEYHYSEKSVYRPGQTTTFTNRYHQIEIPLMIHFSRTIHGRLGVSSGIGLAAVYSFSNHYKLYDYRVYHYATAPIFLRNFNLALQGQLMAEYRLNSRFMLQAGIDASYNMLSTYADYYPINQKQYSVGGMLGVQWRFKGQ